MTAVVGMQEMLWSESKVSGILVIVGYGAKSSKVEQVAKSVRLLALREGVPFGILHVPFLDEELDLPWIISTEKTVIGRGVTEEELVDLVIGESIATLFNQDYHFAHSIEEAAVNV